MHKMQDEKLECLLIHVPKMLEWEPSFGWIARINFLATGMLSIAEELNLQNITCRILHLGVEKMRDPKFCLSDYVERRGVKYVGFSLHWHPQTYDTLEAARHLKQDLPEVFIVLGGYTASYFAKQILEAYPFVDAVVRGEGEIPLATLINKEGMNLPVVPNLTWRDEYGTVHENPIGFVAEAKDLDKWKFDLHYLENRDLYYTMDWRLPWNPSYRSKAGLPTFYGFPLGRGCLRTCTWCGGSHEPVKKVTGRARISLRSPDAVAQTVRQYREEGIDIFYVSFDHYQGKEDRLLKIFEALAVTQPPVNLWFEFFYLPSLKVLQAFKKFGADSMVIFSPETFREDVRQRHRGYPFSNAQLEESLTLLDSEKIRCVLYFTVGLPEESRDDIEQTARYQKMLQSKHPCIKEVWTFPLEMEPASPWFEEPATYGIKTSLRTITDFYDIHKKSRALLGYDTAHLRESEILLLYCKLFCNVQSDQCETMRKNTKQNPLDVSMYRQFGRVAAIVNDR